LQRGTGSGTDAEFQDVGEVTDLTAWDASRDTVEVTSHRSPDFSVENIAGLIDWGSASFELNFVPRDAADPETALGALLDDFKSAGNSTWRIIFPEDGGDDVVGIEFLASLTSYQATAPVKDVMKGSFELKISGAPHFITVPVAGNGGNGSNGNGGNGGNGGEGPGTPPAGFTGDTGYEVAA